MAPLRSLGMALLAAIWCLTSSVCKGGDPETARFQSEYPAAGRALEARFRQLKGTCQLIRRDGGRPERRARASFCVDNGKRKVTIHAKRPPTNVEMEMVFCDAGDTGFSVTRMAGRSGYSVGGLNEFGQAGYQTNFGKFLTAPYAVLGQPLWQLMESPLFRLVACREVEVDQHQCIEIEYESRIPTMEHTGTLALDPETAWAIRRGELRLREPMGLTLRFDVQYGPDQDGPLPSLVQFTEPNSTSSCRFDAMEFQPTPDLEFRMSAYGLPNLNEARSSRSWNLTYWLFGLGVLGMVLSWVLWRLARRGRAVIA